MGRLVIGPFPAKFTGSICMTCEEVIHQGESVYWLRGEGTWHASCKTPRSVDMYVREAAKKDETR